MNFKKFGCAVALVAAFGLTACDDDSSSPAAPSGDNGSSVVKDDDNKVPTSSNSAAKDNKSSSSTAISSEDLGLDFDFGDMDPSNMTKEDIIAALDKVPQEDLNKALEEMGMTKEEYVEVIVKLFEAMESEPEFENSCSGELNDDEWIMNVTFDMGFTSAVSKSTVTFDGTTVTTVDESTADLLTEKTCKEALEEDDEELDEETIVEARCEGSKLIRKETTVTKNVTSEARAEMYEEFQEACKTSLSDLMGDDEEDGSIFSLKKSKKASKKISTLKIRK